MKQFSLRDVLLLFVIVALILGWWFDRRPFPARYQLHSAPNSNTWVIDTATGQVWYDNSSEFLPRKLGK